VESRLRIASLPRSTNRTVSFPGTPVNVTASEAIPPKVSVAVTGPVDASGNCVSRATIGRRLSWLVYCGPNAPSTSRRATVASPVARSIAAAPWPTVAAVRPVLSGSTLRESSPPMASSSRIVTSAKERFGMIPYGCQPVGAGRISTRAVSSHSRIESAATASRIDTLDLPAGIVTEPSPVGDREIGRPPTERV